jgi:hypothetical protein
VHLLSLKQRKQGCCNLCLQTIISRLQMVQMAHTWNHFKAARSSVTRLRFNWFGKHFRGAGDVLWNSAMTQPSRRTNRRKPQWESWKHQYGQAVDVDYLWINNLPLPSLYTSCNEGIKWLSESLALRKPFEALIELQCTPSFAYIPPPSSVNPRASVNFLVKSIILGHSDNEWPGKINRGCPRA